MEGRAWQKEVHGEGRHAWRRGGGHGTGVCMTGSCVAGETATAADSTHPTGMHSCLMNVIIFELIYSIPSANQTC